MDPVERLRLLQDSMHSAGETRPNPGTAKEHC
jgi:hypothetical protein